MLLSPGRPVLNRLATESTLYPHETAKSLQNAMTASATETTGEDASERVPPPPARLNRLAAAVPPVAEPATVPALRDFLSTEDHRLRDLLAFGMAAEAGKPLGPDGVADARRKAEAELEAHAFRTLHNQLEAIRREAAAEQATRMARPMSLGRAVLANVVALLLVGAAGFVALTLDPELPARLAGLLAQLKGS
jgi:hypothetical protein